MVALDPTHNGGTIERNAKERKRSVLVSVPGGGAPRYVPRRVLLLPHAHTNNKKKQGSALIHPIKKTKHTHKKINNS